MSHPKPSDQPESIPKSVVGRLSLYLREIQLLIREGSKTTSSHNLGKRLGLTDAQVRKDLANFGQFGYPGIGYRCDQLNGEIRRILGTDQNWSVALVGCGNLGQALLGHDGFQKQGFSIECAFDSDAAIIGREFRGISVTTMDAFEVEISRRQIRLAILAVPTDAAQAVAERMVLAGICGILNFAPITLALPNEIGIVSVDLATKLEQLAFTVVNKLRKE